MGLGVIKEWNCLEHGEFVGSHPLCPVLGCESRAVTRVFLTPPNIGSTALKRFDQGIARSADMYRISNFRSAKAGEASYGGDKARELGMEVLWGNEVQKKMGRSFAELTGLAQQPLVVPKRDGSGVLRMDHNNGMRDAATEVGITRRRLPKAGEVVAARADDAPEKVKALTT
jgi:hypothetical protein